MATAEPGDVLIGKLRPYLGKTLQVAEPILVSTELMILRPARNVDPRWLHYCTMSAPLLEWTVATSDGAKMPRTSWGALGQFEIEVPSVAVQRAIVHFLDVETARIDALIAKKQRMMELLEERRDRALDRAALPGESLVARENPADVPTQRALPGTWTSPSIGLCSRRITYGFTNPMPTTDDGPYMLTANDIGDGSIRYESARHTDRDAFAALSGKSRPERGDVLLTKDGTLGRVAFFDGSEVVCVNQSVAVISPRPDRVLPELLALLLMVPAYREALVFNAGGTGISHLYVTRIAKQRIGLPPVAEQPELARRLRRIHETTEAARAALSRSIELLAERRQALISAAVTGELAIDGVAA